MTTRELPPAEWPRLAETDLADLWPTLDPRSAAVIVVEDEGQIVGHVVLLSMVHAEGLGIAPEHRYAGSVWRRLCRAVGEKARAAGLTAVIAGSATPDMGDYLPRMGATAIPAAFWTLPVTTRLFGRKE